MNPHLLDGDALVLNRVYLPIRVTTVRVAISLLYQDRARGILPDYTTHDFASWQGLAFAEGEGIGTVRGGLRAPRVIVLIAFDGVPRYHVRFTRRNVYARDAHRCQYCGNNGSADHLTLDHVHPLAHGGRSRWENVVTCCVPCNRRKADRTPEKAGMRLQRPPRRPRWHPLHEASRRRPHPDEWRYFVDESILEWKPVSGVGAS